MDELELIDTPLVATGDLIELVARFAFNTLVVWIIIHLLYFPRSKRRDYYFTFMLISVSIFFLIFLLGGLKIKVGFALGLFAIFGIIRYRTESMYVREMTYLFVIIAISVINALAVTLSVAELVAVNALFIGAIWLCELNLINKQHQEKLVVYDRIDLIVPEKHDELVADLEKRIGVKIIGVEIGAIDFLKDTAMLKIHYLERGENSVNHTMKLPKD
ncbi:MAG: DUF4956 domain-containing protein [Muribaculaceae bacterium]|nr:DUF4956 domain-containing protein [Muribaculaceae bacterium]